MKNLKMLSIAICFACISVSALSINGVWAQGTAESQITITHTNDILSPDIALLCYYLSIIML